MAVKKGSRTKKAGKSAAKKGVKNKAAKKQAVKKAVRKTAKKAARKAPAKPIRKTTSPGSKRSFVDIKRKEQMMKLLLKKRNEVVQGLEAHMGRKLSFDSSQRVDSAMDSADQSSADVDQGIDYSLLEMKYRQYKDIADAFRKLEDNTYGVCEECGEEIAIKRLQVNPLARYCIECKTKKEEIERIEREETRFKD